MPTRIFANKPFTTNGKLYQKGDELPVEAAGWHSLGAMERLGRVVVFRDLTEWLQSVDRERANARAREESLQSASKEVEAIVAREKQAIYFSHMVSTPIGVLPYAEIVESEEDLPAAPIEQPNQIQKRARGRK